MVMPMVGGVRVAVVMVRVLEQPGTHQVDLQPISATAMAWSDGLTVSWLISTMRRSKPHQPAQFITTGGAKACSGVACFGCPSPLNSRAVRSYDL
jgi:hypothetical protein